MDKYVCVLLLGLFAIASTHTCEKEGVIPCYDNLTYYDESHFPSRGVGKHQLDEICTYWKTSFDCVEYFTSVCNEHDNCDTNCQNLIDKMKMFVDHSGLTKVKNALCEDTNEMRHAYLKNAKCLNEQMNKFDACRKNWENSYEYVKKIKDKNEMVEKSCCAASFYKGCTINATQDVCELEATNVVRFIFDAFFWLDEQVKMCEVHPVCDTPLLLPLKSSSPPLVKPYSLVMYFMFLSVLVIKY